MGVSVRIRVCSTNAGSFERAPIRRYLDPARVDIADSEQRKHSLWQPCHLYRKRYYCDSAQLPAAEVEPERDYTLKRNSTTSPSTMV